MPAGQLMPADQLLQLLRALHSGSIVRFVLVLLVALDHN